jgi:CubicO group peptidase (beta-lactamase class C family)
MADTTFYPTAAQQLRLAKPYQSKDGQLSASKLPAAFDPTISGRVPMANGGLFSTASDYGRFCQLILNHGTVDGRHYLSPASVSLMTSVQSGDLVTGFTPGNGWGFGWCVIRHPQGVSAALSPGSFGHGGAFGTQVWIDPVKELAYVLLVSRSNFPNSDGSDIRRDFHNAVAAALAK